MLTDKIRNQFRNCMIGLCIFLPILSLAINAISWLRFGIDIPFMDDWRFYHQKSMGILNLGYLFQPANDTLYPVGKALDSLASIYLDGNTIAYQFISMISVLGLLLLLQWRLLSLALNNRLLTASAFVFTILMLQPDNYWGLQNIAYHQALPLIGILASIYIVLCERWNNLWSVFALIALGLFSGLSYISGAFAILALSIVFLSASYFIQPNNRQPFRIGGLSLLIVGLVTALAQSWVIAIFQKGTHRPDAPMAYPIEGDFWLYLLGKFGRSLMLPIERPLFSLVITGILTIIILLYVFSSIKCIIKCDTRITPEIKTSIIYISLFSAIFIYLILVSAGRTNLRPPEIKSITELFAFGFTRFHYYWATLLWPWLIALIFLTLKKLNSINIKIPSNSLALIFTSIFIPIILYAGALNHSDFYKRILGFRVEGMKCLLSETQKKGEIHCPQLYPPTLDLSVSISYAKEIGASFTRILSFYSESTETAPQN